MEGCLGMAAAMPDPQQLMLHQQMLQNQQQQLMQQGLQTQAMEIQKQLEQLRDLQGQLQGNPAAFQPAFPFQQQMPQQDTSQAMLGMGMAGGGSGADQPVVESPPPQPVHTGGKSKGKGEKGKGKGKGKPKGCGPPEPIDAPDVEQHKIFVASLPRNVQEQNLHQHFSQFGEVQEVRLKYDPNDGTFRGFAFVTFTDKAVARAILENYDNNYYEGKWIACVPVKARPSKGPGKGKVIEMTEGMSADKLFVSGLPQTTTEETLRAYFETFGPIASIRLIYNPGEGTFRGFAFVTFEQEEAGKMVMASYEDHIFDGKWIECQPARPKDEELKGGGKGGSKSGPDSGWGGGDMWDMWSGKGNMMAMMAMMKGKCGKKGFGGGGCGWGSPMSGKGCGDCWGGKMGKGKFDGGMGKDFGGGKCGKDFGGGMCSDGGKMGKGFGKGFDGGKGKFDGEMGKGFDGGMGKGGCGCGMSEDDSWGCGSKGGGGGCKGSEAGGFGGGLFDESAWSNGSGGAPGGCSDWGGGFASWDAGGADGKGGPAGWEGDDLKRPADVDENGAAAVPAAFAKRPRHDLMPG